MNIRQHINQVVCNVLFKQQSLSQCLPAIQSRCQTESDRRLIQAFSYGVCRWYHRLEKLTQQLLEKPLRPKDQDIQGLIVLGLYQLLYSDVPEHAAIYETVNAVPRKKPWARGLVNKILRRFIAEKTALLAIIDENLVARYAHPQWLIDTIQRDYPNHWATILDANNAMPPLFLRINPLKTDIKTYLALLKQADIPAKAVMGYPHAIHIINPVPTQQLPKFEEGWCSVQDIAGQRIPGALALTPNLRVLDACAAPGSKTCHILETQPELSELTAIDCDKKRLSLVDDNLRRLQLPQTNTQLIHADATDTQSWWNGKLFDRILVDAPCSGSGVIRRHPDIKCLRRDSDISQFVEKQTQLIEALRPLLSPTGRLVYSTCSIIRAETLNASLKTREVDQQLPTDPEQPDGFSFVVD